MTRHWFIITFALLLIATKALGFYQDTNKTIEYRVSIFLDGGVSCGGTILDDHHILTAAYCVLEPSGIVYPSKIEVMRDEEDTPMSVETIYVPRQFNKTCGTYEPVENIAIIKLQEKIGLSEHPILKKINLPESQRSDIYEKFENKLAIIAGYGVTEIDVNVTENGDLSRGTKVTHPQLLQLAKAKVLSTGECQMYWHSVAPIQPTEMCARINAQKYHGICQADFGNGLIYKNTVIGVLISSNALCYEDKDFYNVPAVYTRVTPYVEFIQHVLSGKLTDDECSFKANGAQNSYDRDVAMVVSLSVIVGLVLMF